MIDLDDDDIIGLPQNFRNFNSNASHRKHQPKLKSNDIPNHRAAATHNQFQKESQKQEHNKSDTKRQCFPVHTSQTTSYNFSKPSFQENQPKTETNLPKTSQHTTANENKKPFFALYNVNKPPLPENYHVSSTSQKEELISSDDKKTPIAIMNQQKENVFQTRDRFHAEPPTPEEIRELEKPWEFSPPPISRLEGCKIQPRINSKPPKIEDSKNAEFRDKPVRPEDESQDNYEFNDSLKDVEIVTMREELLFEQEIIQSFQQLEMPKYSFNLLPKPPMRRPRVKNANLYKDVIADWDGLFPKFSFHE